MNFKLSLLLLLFYNINHIHCNNYYRSSKLLAPPPRVQSPVQNHLHRKHETRPRNSKSVQNLAEPGVKKAEKKKAGGGILTSLVNSVMSLFPFGNKRLSVKVVRNKSQNKIKSKQFVKQQPKKAQTAKNLKLPHKKIPIKSKSHIRPPSSHVKNNKIPVRRPAVSQAASNSVNENSLPNKRQIKNLVVELHKTVEHILQKQSSNRTSSVNSSSRVINQTGVRNIAPVVAGIRDKPPQMADQSPPSPERSQHHESASNDPVRGSGNKFPPNHPKSDKVKRLVNNKRYQTSFSTSSLDTIKDGDMKDEFEFKPFVPNFLLLEAGSDSKESDPSSVMSKESKNFKDSSDASKPSLRASNDGVEILETQEHTLTSNIDRHDGCSDPVAGCYEKILDEKIIQLQREMNRLEERYWGNRV